MKLQHKLLALAVMGLAAAAPAHATINNGATTPGNGELFFSLWSDNGSVSTTDDVSYMRDLGVNIDDWANSATFALTAAKTTAGYVQNFAANSMLTSFLSAIPSGAVVHWNVVGNDAYQAKRFVSTAAVGTAALPTQSASNSRLVNTAIGSFLSTVNPFADAQNSTVLNNATNNSNTATTANAAYAGGGLFGTNLGGKTVFDTTGGIGAKLPFFLQYETSSIQTGNALQKQFTDSANPVNTAYWQLDAGGNLSYNVAAVPEADTWAMFAAGLIAVGAIARRRMAA